MELRLKDILTDREHWNFFDWSQGSARIGLVDGETCFVPFTLAMKKLFANQHLPIHRVIRPGVEIKFSQVLCEDKFFLGLVSKESKKTEPCGLSNSQDFPWEEFMRIVTVAQHYFVAEQEITLWRVNNLVLTNINEIFLHDNASG